MSSFPLRSLEVWRSSLAESISPLNGVFAFDVLHTVMVPQTLQFLANASFQSHENFGKIASGFILGMHFFQPDKPNLLYKKSFRDAEELFSFDPAQLSEAIRQLELHIDINLTFGRVTYLADVGRGPELPLLVLSRLPFSRGVAFEVEERDVATNSMLAGDFDLHDKARLAQQHYSTGMSLLAGEDSVSGLVDAAFMQFYLTIEVVLEQHDKGKALRQGRDKFGAEFNSSLQDIVNHVYIARQRFFGHAHAKYIKGLLDTDVAFDIAKQCLVARWCARHLLELELKRPLLKREMRLYPRPGQSVAFFGNSDSLRDEFALPD